MSSSPASPCVSRRTPRRAFTLIELLVAMTVLSVIMVMLGQIFGVVSQAWSDGQRRVNNFTKARAMLDLFSRDVQMGVFRDDLACFPGSAAAFYTRQPGVGNSTGTPRQISLVLYDYSKDTTSTTGMSTLQRSDLAVSWANSGAMISFGDATTLPTLDQVVARDISPGIVDWKLTYLYSDGTSSTTYSATTTKKLCSLGLTLAVVDDQTLQNLTTDQLTSLRTALEGAATGNPSAAWENYLRTGLPWDTYPRSLRVGLRIFQRYVALPNL